MASETKGLAIIGLGNPLRGDDGIGPRVVEELARHNLPEGVVVCDGGTGGLALLSLLEGWERVIVVDAADVGKRPGQFVRFEPEQVELGEKTDRSTAGASSSLHNAGLADVLALAHALEEPLPPIVIFGVQPEQMGWGEGLSLPVEATLPGLVNAILKEVGEDNAQDFGY